MTQLKSFILFTIAILFAAACQPLSPTASDTKTSREGRAALGRAESIDPDWVSALDENLLRVSWSAQDRVGTELWAQLNQKVDREQRRFAKWQTWYSKEDLQRVFRIAYQRLSIEERSLRRALSVAEIEAALSYHDREQFLEASWNQSAFERWLARYEGEEKAQAIPGLNKVLMNQTALLALLLNYSQIDACYRLLSQTMPCKNFQMRFPRGSAFMKTAWRRGQVEGDFAVPLYQTDDLLIQMTADEWQSHGSVIPLSTEAMRMQTPTGQVFHLAGVHVVLKLDTLWLWSSQWLDVGEPRANYRSCAVMGFKPLALAENGGFEAEVSRVEALTGSSWCSNPYLEGGQHNHKTNCIGCHQHAGVPWTESDFNERLVSDLALLQSDAGVRSRSDQLWSLLNGPEPLVSPISQEIDYFDVYDL